MQNTAHARQAGGPRRVCVILNCGSGKRRTEAQGRIRVALAECGITAEIKVLSKGSQIIPAARRALADGFDTIVAAGGDGTISGVAGVLRGTDAAMGILPLGTFNYFARSLDIPTDIDGAARLVAQGAQRSVGIATINDRVFLNNASLGAYPAILKTREDIYHRWGRSRIAAYWSVLVTLVTLRRPLQLSIDTGDRVIERRTPLVFTVNNAFQLDQIHIEGREHISVGRLALFIAPDSGRWGMVRHALSLATGTAQDQVNFELVAAKRIRIDARRSPRDVACDGERSRMRAPFDLTTCEGALTVIVPEARRDGTR